MKHGDTVSLGCPDTEKRVGNTTPAAYFLTLLSMFGHPDETLFLVFDILLPT